MKMKMMSNIVLPAMSVSTVSVSTVSVSPASVSPATVSTVSVSAVTVLIPTVGIMTRSGLPDLGALFLSCSGCGGSASQAEHQSAVVDRSSAASAMCVCSRTEEEVEEEEFG